MHTRVQWQHWRTHSESLDPGPYRCLKLIPMLLLALICSSPAAFADEQRVESSPMILGSRVDSARLAEVRAGTPIPEASAQHLSVILWDELRIPPPPVRDRAGDSRVTAQMNMFQKP
jgi:hypothetical protein